MGLICQHLLATWIIQVAERCLSKFSNPSFITCSTCTILTTRVHTEHSFFVLPHSRDLRSSRRSSSTHKKRTKSSHHHDMSYAYVPAGTRDTNGNSNEVSFLDIKAFVKITDCHSSFRYKRPGSWTQRHLPSGCV